MNKKEIEILKEDLAKRLFKKLPSEPKKTLMSDIKKYIEDSEVADIENNIYPRNYAIYTTDTDDSLDNIIKLHFPEIESERKYWFDPEDREDIDESINFMVFNRRFPWTLVVPVDEDHLTKEIVKLCLKATKNQNLDLDILFVDAKANDYYLYKNPRGVTECVELKEDFDEEIDNIFTDEVLNDLHKCAATFLRQFIYAPTSGVYDEKKVETYKKELLKRLAEVNMLEEADKAMAWKDLKLKFLDSLGIEEALRAKDLRPYRALWRMAKKAGYFYVHVLPALKKLMPLFETTESLVERIDKINPDIDVEDTLKRVYNNDFEEMQRLAEVIGIDTASDLENFMRREALMDEEPLDTLRRYIRTTFTD